MLPRPRRRVDPELIRERLRALAFDVGPSSADLLSTGPRDEADGTDGADEEIPAIVRTSVRSVVVAVAATALAMWVLLRVAAGGPPTPVELTPGTPIAGPASTTSGGTASGGAADAAGPVSSTAGSATAVAVAGSPAPSAPAEVVVQVVGQVRRPGLVHLLAGARVADAITAAGGLRAAGASGGLNLARLVVDGEQIVVSPTIPPGAAAPSAASVTGPPSGAPVSVVDLNTAGEGELDALPGVGPVTAARILAWRAQHGRFATIDQLREVPGIGDKTLARLRAYLRV